MRWKDYGWQLGKVYEQITNANPRLFKKFNYRVVWADNAKARPRPREPLPLEAYAGRTGRSAAGLLEDQHALDAKAGARRPGPRLRREVHGSASAAFGDEVKAEADATAAQQVARHTEANQAGRGGDAEEEEDASAVERAKALARGKAEAAAHELAEHRRRLFMAAAQLEQAERRLVPDKYSVSQTDLHALDDIHTKERCPSCGLWRPKRVRYDVSRFEPAEASASSRRIRSRACVRAVRARAAAQQGVPRRKGA